MAYVPLAQAQAQYIGKSMLSSGNIYGGYTPLEQAQTQFINTKPTPSVSRPVSAPTPKPVSQQPSIFQNIQNEGQRLVQGSESVAQNIINQVKGIFTPTGGKPQPITTKTPATPGKIQLTQQQQQAIGQMKPGQIIPDFQSSQQPVSAQTKKPSNIIDDLFKVPDNIIGGAQNFLSNPSNRNIAGSLAVVQKKILEPLLLNPVTKPIVKGITETYLGSSQKVMDTLNTPVNHPPTVAGQAYNTVGEIAGQTLSFLAGGEVLKGLQFGKLTLPVLFAAIGQTSSPSNTSALQRIEKLPVDAIAGWLLRAIPGANKLISAASLRQAGLSAGVLSANTLVDSMIQGMSKEDGLKAAAQMAVIAGIFHITGSAMGIIGDKALGSQVKDGSAEFTPDQARAVVVGSNLEKTQAGAAIIKASLDAQAQGKNIKIELSAAKESPVAGVVKKFTNLQTPNGIKINNIELVEPSAQITTASPETPKAGSLEDLNNAAEGWKPGVKAQFDEALGTGDAATVQKLLPEVPDYYKSRMQERITAIGAQEEKPAENIASAPTPEAEKQIQENSLQYVKENPDKIYADYNKAVYAKYGLTNIVGSDEAKPILPGYHGTLAKPYHEASSKIAQMVYDRKLQEHKGQGNNTVLFTAGGTGVGKTSALKETGTNIKDYSIVYDSNLTGPNAKSKIQKALDNGYKVQVAFVHRDPVESFVNGVIPRIKTEGRIVPLSEHIARHSVALSDVYEIQQHFGKKIDITFIDNTGKKEDVKISTLADLPRFSYTKAELTQILHEKTNEAISNKQITEEHGKAITSNAVVRGRSETGNSQGRAGTGGPTEEKPLASSQEPVGTGKLKESTAFKKFVDQLKEEDPKRYEELQDNKVKYNTLNLEKDAENAMKLVQENPEKAYRIAKGVESAPQGQTETAISIALANRAEEEKNYTLQADLEASRSLRQTRRGQEIVSERGRFNENSPHVYIQKLMATRLNQIGRSLTTDLKQEMLQDKISAKQGAVKMIDRQVENLSKKIRAQAKKEALTLDVQKFIDDLICK